MSRLGELESSELLSRFVSQKEGIYNPANPYLAEAAEIRLVKDRKGQLVSAELKIAFPMLEHPVLGRVSSDLVRDFFALCLSEPPRETSSKKWLSDETDSRLKCPGATIYRRRQDDVLYLNVEVTKGLLSGWFGR